MQMSVNDHYEHCLT